MRCRISICTLALASAAVLCACGSDEPEGTGAAGPGSQSSSSGSGGSGEGGAGASGANGGTGQGGGGAGSGGVPVDCDSLPAAPIEPELVTEVFDDSEDIAFDGKGHIVGKQGAAIVQVDAAETVTDLANLADQVYGLRYHVDGNLIAALPQQGRLVRISSTGEVTDWVSGLSGPNGIYPDLDGNVWVTEFGGGKVTRVGMDGQKNPVASGTSANAPNGIVLDASKSILFYTEYQEGKIQRVDTDVADAMPVEVVTILDAALDGLVLDACGNLYAVDQGNSRVYRLKLDAEGVLMGAPELLATLPQNVANAQFGSGDGFDPQKLYLAGVPGAVYSIDAGVPGAPVPTPP